MNALRGHAHAATQTTTTTLPSFSHTILHHAAQPAEQSLRPSRASPLSHQQSIMSQVTLLNKNKACGGVFEQYTHPSTATHTPMRFTVFFPPQATTKKAVPALYYLSGLTCTDENVVQKGFAQQRAAARGLALIAPDTSPRGAGVEGEDDGWDFGTGVRGWGGWVGC